MYTNITWTNFWNFVLELQVISTHIHTIIYIIGDNIFKEEWLLKMPKF